MSGTVTLRVIDGPAAGEWITVARDDWRPRIVPVMTRPAVSWQDAGLTADVEYRTYVYHRVKYAHPGWRILLEFFRQGGPLRVDFWPGGERTRICGCSEGLRGEVLHPYRFPYCDPEWRWPR